MAIREMEGFDTEVPSVANGWTIASNRGEMELLPSPDGDNMLRLSTSAGTAGIAAVMHIGRQVPNDWGNSFRFGVQVSTITAVETKLACIDTVPSSGANGIITLGKTGLGFVTINGVTTDIPFETTVYHYLELEIDKVALTARAWLNNQLVGTAPLTGSEGALQYWFGFDGITTGTAKTGHVSYNDMYEADSNGDLNTQRLGRVKVVTSLPEEDAIVEFSRLGGTSNASQVADPGPPDGNTSYVYSNQAGAVDLYTNNDPLPFPEAPVLAVSVTVTARKEGPEARSVAPMIQVDGADEVGDRLELIVNTYRTTRTVFNANPKTGGAWDPASAASMRFGQTLVI